MDRRQVPQRPNPPGRPGDRERGLLNLDYDVRLLSAALSAAKKAAAFLEIRGSSATLRPDGATAPNRSAHTSATSHWPPTRQLLRRNLGYRAQPVSITT
ncbi:hypothetical protein EF294_09720 [Gordonia oryzae]|uniref:Uncharacterized protein n=1 Tax=Gordonia oryzae TaxID=2487349 RepID=A0A3N4GJD0_9ACTN|nr:hypothetical protein EF294_09720 [Gordonia oryzae]